MYHLSLHPKDMLEENEKTLAVPSIELLAKELDDSFTALREKTREVIERLLIKNASRTFRRRSITTLEDKTSFADQIRERLQRVGLRIKCPICGQPSMLRAALAGSSKNGVFQFDHSSKGTHGGGSFLQANLKIAEAPVDGRLRKSSEKK